MKNINEFKVGATYFCIEEIDDGFFVEHLCTVTNRTATTINFNDKPFNYVVKFSDKKGGEYVCFKGGIKVLARDEFELYRVENVANQNASQKLIEEVTGEIVTAAAIDASVDAMEDIARKSCSADTKKFKLDAVYKTTTDADSISRHTYTMQVYNRTACYIQANVWGKVERYKVKVDANGVEYINVTRHDGRRAIIFTADSEYQLQGSPLFGTKEKNEPVSVGDKNAAETPVKKAVAVKSNVKYKLSLLESNIGYCEKDIESLKQLIDKCNRRIAERLSEIANIKDTITRYKLSLEDFINKLEGLKKKQKKLKDDIATANAFRVINSLAVDIEDDGSNDDPDENENVITVDINITDDEDNDDDELMDEPEPEPPIVEVAATFDLQIFNNSESVDQSPSPKKFEVGKRYPLYGICYKVISRDNVTVTFLHDTTTTRKEVEFDAHGNEVIYGFEVLGCLESTKALNRIKNKKKDATVIGANI